MQLDTITNNPLYGIDALIQATQKQWNEAYHDSRLMFHPEFELEWTDALEYLIHLSTYQGFIGDVRSEIIEEIDLIEKDDGSLELVMPLPNTGGFVRSIVPNAYTRESAEKIVHVHKRTLELIAMGARNGDH